MLLCSTKHNCLFILIDQIHENLYPSLFSFFYFYQVKIIWWVFSKIRQRISVLICTTHEGLKDGKENAAIGRYFTFFPYFVWLDANQCVFRKCRECIVGLVGQDIPVS